MAWNEPGNKNKDPWGDRKGKQDGPPDIDEIIKNTFGKLFGGKGGSGGGSGGGNAAVPAWILPLAIVLFVIYYIGQGVGVVNEQERAVVLRLGKFATTKGPGIRWNPPFIDKVFTVNVTSVRNWTTQEQMLTKDLNIVDVKLSTQFIINNPKDFVLNVKNPEESLRQAANSALRHVVGSTVMHEVLTEGRSRVAVEIQDRLQANLSSYTTGITITTVNVEDTNPPKEVQRAFDDVIRAREDEERFKNEAQAYANEKIPNARGRSQRMIEEAMAYREEVVAKAEGEAERFTLLLAEYKKAPKVTRQRLYIETMEQVLGHTSKVMVDVEGGNNMMYIPLDKIIESGGKNSASRAAQTGVNDIDDLASRIAERVIQEATTQNARRRESR